MKRAGSALVLLLAAQEGAYAAASAETCGGAPGGALATVQIVGVAPIAGLGLDRKLLPYAVQSATDEQIGQAQGANLAEFMARNLAGVNIADISGSPFQADITYRGFRVSPVLGSAQGVSVYLDGVRINEAFGDVVNWDMLPEAALASVLLVPGSNPLYGLNTLGGALALTGKNGSSHPGFEADLSASDFGRKRIDLAQGAAGEGGWHGFAGATVFDDAGWRDHSRGRLAKLYAKAGKESARLGWSATLLAGASRLRGNGLLPDAMAQENPHAAYSHPDATRNRLLQGSANLRWRIDPATEASALAYARSSRRDTVNGDVELDDGELEGEFNSTGTRQRSQGASALLSMRRGVHRIDAGATFDRSSMSFAQHTQDGILSASREVAADPGAQREPGSSVVGSARAFGLFGTDTWRLGRATHLTASARYSYAKVGNTLTSARGPQAPESFTYRQLNPALGIAHDLAPGLTLSFNVAQGNRVPTVIELGCADPLQPCLLPVGLQSDPYLEQVIARTAEAGARYARGGATASVSLYRTVNRDDILFLSSGLTRLGYFANFERTRHQGVDAAASAAAGAWSWRASYSYLDAAYDAPGTLFTGLRTVAVQRGTPLAGLPRHTIKLALDWRAAPALHVGADLQALSPIGTQGNEDGLLSDPEAGLAPQSADLRVRGYALLNLTASWEAGSGWELYARVNNVLDRRHASYGAVARNLFSQAGVEGENSRFVAPGAPRTFTAGLRLRY